MKVSRVVDIVGTALVLGLVLRYANEFAVVVSAGGSAITNFYNAVAMSGTSGTPVRVGGQS